MSSKQTLTDWNSDLFDCCQDRSSCCYGFFCCPCLACSVAGKFGENRCLPLCDICSSAFGIPLFSPPAALSLSITCSPAVWTASKIPLIAPPAALSLRAGIRNRYGVKGSLCEDIIASCCCLWCTWCQMHREL
nr:cornifelin homolog B-like [Nerophis lumbriciformis]